MYERGGSLERRKFENILVCGAFLPPGSGYNKLNSRFLSLFNVIQILQPDEENIEKIYNTIFLRNLKTFPNNIKEMA